LDRVLAPSPYGTEATMNWLYEQQLVIVVIGVALILGLGAAWSASGRKELLFAMAGALLLLIAGLVIERLVVTDREAIRATLAQMAHDVQSNNRRAIVEHIYSGAPQLKRQVEAELRNYHFTECRITRINKIEVDDHMEPRSAIVEFNVIGSGSSEKDSIGELEHIPRWVRLQMIRETDGRWTVAKYDHDSPERMLFDDSKEGRPGRR
jgi:hypothetical protein